MPRSIMKPENQENKMQKIRTCVFIAACLCLSQQSAFAEDVVDHTITHPIEEGVSASEPEPVKEVDKNQSQIEDDTTETDDSSPTAKDYLSEIIIRPVAVVGSVTGLAMFIVASPFSGLASIPEPHDAFKITWDNFVVTPYHFAFRRPFGDYSVELN